MRGPDMKGAGRGMLAAGVATVLVVGTLLWTWSDLWVAAPVWRLVVVALCGAIPAAAIVADRGAWPRAALIAGWLASVVIVIGVATDVSIVALVRLRGDTWSFVRSLIDEGFSTAATVTIPLTEPGDRAITALLLIVVATTTSALVALAFIARRPIAAVVALMVAVAYRWTLVPPERPLRDGLIVVGVILAVLALIPLGPGRRGRHPARLLLSGGAVVVIAALVSGAGWGQEGAWWNWREWSWGDTTTRTLTVSASQTYGPLDYSGEPVTIARVTTDHPTFLRQEVLDRFDGISFTEDRGWPERATVDGTFTPSSGTSGPGTRIADTIELTGMRSEWLLTAGDLRGVSGIGRRSLDVYPDGTVAVRPPLSRGTTYRVDAVLPEPDVAKLVAARRYAAGEVDDEDLTVDVGSGLPSVTAPVFGTSSARPDPAAFGPYAEVYRLSRRIIGDAASPYVAVNRLESHLRSPDVYTYDTDVERPGSGMPDLAYFLLTSRRGYCQQFAGSLALMLRMNGIPARVAVGLNVGSDGYDATTGTYTVTDRDVHSWVEVRLPGQEWLPFDPTPATHSVANPASVAASDYRAPETSVDPSTEVAPAPVAAVDPTPLPDPGTVPDPAPPAPSVAPEGGASWWLAGLAAMLLAIAGVAAVPLAKIVRRRRRRRGPPRDQVLGAARELESLLADLGAPPDAAATGGERASTARRELGIDAGLVYRLATDARFSPGTPTDDEADAAWRQVDGIRRGLRWRTRVAASLRVRSLRRSRTGR